MSRRTFLGSLGALGLSACGGGAVSSIPSATSVEKAQGNFRAAPALAAKASSSGFVHPGLLHTQADFTRMASKVKAKASPWIDGWNRLTSNSVASTSWKPNPQSEVTRYASGAGNYMTMAYDVAAAYANALRWNITGDTTAADTAVSIMNAWSSTLTDIGGDITGFLVSGIYGYQFANAGEMMRSYSGWKAADFAAFQNMMHTIFGTQQVYTRGIQSCEPLTVYSNWQLCCLATTMAIGVLCDDQTMFDAAISYLENGIGNGAIAQTIYYIHPGYLGQTQESGRDQGHDTLSMSLLSNICEMAWNQGVDLYGYRNNRVLAAFEYVAKGNLIESGSTYYSIPFATYVQQGIYDTEFSTGSIGNARPEWALIYNHYVNRMGLAAPYSQKFAEQMSPEGGGGEYGGNSGGFDQLGYGTLAYTLDPIAVGAAPSGLTAYASQGQVLLSWWGTAYLGTTVTETVAAQQHKPGEDWQQIYPVTYPLRSAPTTTTTTTASTTTTTVASTINLSAYTVKRSTASGGPYTVIATGITDLLTYTDTPPAAGTYYYVVTAVTPSGESAASNQAVVTTATELIAYLAFDDGSGTTASDSTGNGNNGTLVGGATWATGKIGGAVSLDGSSGYVSLPTGIVDNLADFTIAAWVYWKGGSNWQRVFDFGKNTLQYMFLTPQNSGGVVHFGVALAGGAGEQGINGTASLPSGKWVHVAVTLAGTTGTLYVNGVVAGINSAITFPPYQLGSNSQNWIGRSQFSADPYFNGLIDEFKICSGALSAAQVAALAAA